MKPCPHCGKDITVPPKKRTSRKQATELLDFLNELTGKNFRPVDGNLKMIEQRFHGL